MTRSFLASNLLCLLWHFLSRVLGRLALDLLSPSPFFFGVQVLISCLVRFCSSAGVQPVCAGEQKGSRVEEKGSRTGHREADLRRLLASGETFL